METLKEFTNVTFTREQWVYIVPGVLMLIDFLSGFLNAWKRNEIKSSKMREGFIKKCGETLGIIVVEILRVSMGLNKGFVIAASTYIILMELISICENLDKIGVPVPSFIKKALKSAHEKIQNDPNNLGKEDKDGN